MTPSSDESMSQIPHIRQPEAAHLPPPAYESDGIDEETPEEELPSYREKPATRAERLWWIGCIFRALPSFLLPGSRHDHHNTAPAWIWGMLYLWMTQDPLRAAGFTASHIEAQTRRRWPLGRQRPKRRPATELGWNESTIAQSRLAWRQEEQAWAVRCLQGILFVAILGVLVFLVVLYSVET